MKPPPVTLEDVRHAIVVTALCGFVALNAVAEVANARASEAPRPAEPATFRATAYCIHGITASGARTGPGTVAASSADFRFGQRLYIEGYGDAVVQDRGGAITRGRLDVWFSSCRDAINWGVRYVRVFVLP